MEWFILYLTKEVCIDFSKYIIIKDKELNLSERNLYNKHISQLNEIIELCTLVNIIVPNEVYEKHSKFSKLISDNKIVIAKNKERIENSYKEFVKDLSYELEYTFSDMYKIIEISLSLSGAMENTNNIEYYEYIYQKVHEYISLFTNS